jgi:hypothetical protein
MVGVYHLAKEQHLFSEVLTVALDIQPSFGYRLGNDRSHLTTLLLKGNCEIVSHQPLPRILSLNGCTNVDCHHRARHVRHLEHKILRYKSRTTLKLSLCRMHFTTQPLPPPPLPPPHTTTTTHTVKKNMYKHVSL